MFRFQLVAQTAGLLREYSCIKDNLSPKNSRQVKPPPLPLGPSAAEWSQPRARAPLQTSSLFSTAEIGGDAEKDSCHDAKVERKPGLLGAFAPWREILCVSGLFRPLRFTPLRCSLLELPCFPGLP
jgi:hypothetical protein